MSNPIEQTSVSSNAGTNATGVTQTETVSTTKRALLKFSWMAPLIVAVNLPKSAAGASFGGALPSGKDKDKKDKKDKKVKR
jgi:hypothetical protein